jgi:hypothetical protein
LVRAGLGCDHRRSLGVADASLIVVGSIVGAGILLVSAEFAAMVRSPAEFLAPHPRPGVTRPQAAGLGSHSPTWRARHAAWARRTKG